MPRLWYNVLLLNWFCSSLFMKLREGAKNWSKKNLCVRPYSCSEWSRTFESQELSCLESWLKFPLLFIWKKIKKPSYISGFIAALNEVGLLSVKNCLFFLFDTKTSNFSGMQATGRPTRPLPVPGPWGLPGQYQVFAGTRLKTTHIPFWSPITKV